MTFSDIEAYEDGSFSDPTIESHGFTETERRIAPETEFLKWKGEQAFRTLLKLRGRICDMLDKHGIGVLPETEWRKPVPGLRASEEVFAGTAGEPVRGKSTARNMKRTGLLDFPRRTETASRMPYSKVKWSNGMIAINAL